VGQLLVVRVLVALLAAVFLLRLPVLRLVWLDPSVVLVDLLLE